MAAARFALRIRRRFDFANTRNVGFVRQMFGFRDDPQLQQCVEVPIYCLFDVESLERVGVDHLRRQLRYRLQH